MFDEAPERQEYACAIGMAILALNDAESEIFSLLRQLISERSKLTEADLDQKMLKLEASFFSDKLEKLRKLAGCYSDSPVRTRLFKIVEDGRRLGDERNNFAHGLLWFDPFDGKHQRRWVPKFTREPTHDCRTPQQIIEVSREIKQLADDAAVLATELRNS